MRIAEVSVNIKNLPTKEQLIKQALKSKKYYQKRNALELIEKEIKASGLFKTASKRAKKSNSDASGLSGLSTSRKRKVDKTEDKG